MKLITHLGLTLAVIALIIALPACGTAHVKAKNCKPLYTDLTGTLINDCEQAG